MDTQPRTAHTPGPWKPLDNDADQNHGHLMVSSEGEAIAIIHALNPDHHASARLIAAAPDLLAALERCIDWIERIDLSAAVDGQAPDFGLNHARATVALARGEARDA